ncbi:MAG: hypothetical protein ABRQ39_11865 [Candidatus Eremiobacterota bacterium]
MPLIYFAFSTGHGMTIMTVPMPGVGVTVGVDGTAVKFRVTVGVEKFVMPGLSSPQDVRYYKA